MLSVGRYQLLETLGEGGMGVVYKAFDPLIRRTVAVKLISARLDDSPELRQRFFSEARAAGQLSHRNIVTIFDLGEDNGHPYFAMEYLEGRNLRARMQSFERMSLGRKLEVMSHVCEGLAYAHSKGVTHRDVKPANIFITDAGEVKVLDFGLARLPASELTHSKTLIGTLNYMAPEQIAGEKIDHRTDVFAVGVVFYEMLSGRSPFEADSVVSLLNKILHEEPRPLASLDLGIPAALEALVGRAMAKAREDRYQGLGDLLIDLAECRVLTRASDPGSGSRPADLHQPPGAGRRTPSRDSHPSNPSGVPMSPPVIAGVSGGPARAGPPSNAARLSSAPRRRVALLGGALVVVAVAIAGTWLASIREAATSGGRRSPATEGMPGHPVGTIGITRPENGVERQAPPVTENRPAGEDVKATRQESPPPPGPGADRSGADAAMAALRSAMASADGANAMQLAPSTYRQAADSEADATRLFEEGRFPAAIVKSYQASGLFRRAEIEAKAEQEKRANEARQAAQQAPPGASARAAGSDAAAPTSSEVRVPGPEFRVPGSEVRGPGPTAPGVPLATQPPSTQPPLQPPAVQPPAVRPPADAGIRELLAKYVEALEARDLQALKRIWPGLSGGEERAIRDEFEHARSIAVDLVNPVVEVADGSATVTCSRRYALVTLDGHNLATRNATTFALRRIGTAWQIDSVRHEVSR